MKVISSPRVMNTASRRLMESGKSIGFVPTMGALHDGHLSLIERAKKENDIVVVSVFVNSKQFCRGEDYKKYPRNKSIDRIKAAKAGCDILFCPGNGSIYKKDFKTCVEVHGLSDVMCGLSRPGHFKGVTLICLKLFNIVMPQKVYFGQKDYQQSVIIKKMVKDLDVNVKITVLPTVRELSGLAMSSRNSYLSAREKKIAGLVYKSLKDAKRAINAGKKRPARIISDISALLEKNDMDIDYVKIVDPATLNDVKQIRSRALIALAVKIGKTRLIDNILVRANHAY